MTTPRLTVDEIDTIRHAQALLRRYATLSPAEEGDATEAMRIADALRTLTVDPGYRLVPMPENSVTARLERVEHALRLLTNHFDLTYVHDSGGLV